MGQSLQGAGSSCRSEITSGACATLCTQKQECDKPETLKDNRTAFFKSLTLSHWKPSENALEFMYPRGVVSDEWFFYLLNCKNKLDSLEANTDSPASLPEVLVQ